ncbi:MAG TPA: glycosyltransferase family 4 protein [Pyrinomonadaceae bacterium]|nr:glycosyltransferase family 4 protein [Pyrinomonadaceae bacterium]
MRILQLSSARAFGGGERHVADLANGLLSRGHDVFAAVRPASPLTQELRVSAANITTFNLRNALDAFSAGKLARLVREREIQIVHAHVARDYPLAAYAVWRNRGSKLVLTRHVLFPLKRLHSLTFSRAARVVAVSAAVQRALIAQHLLPTERIEVIHNGIDVARFGRATATEITAFRNRWRIAEDALLIGSVGELTPLKGHGEFLQAAAIVRQRFPKTQFLIAGLDASHGERNLAELRAQIKRLGLADSVRLLDWVDDLACLYQALDIFVSASHTESFGLAIAEAMASSTPVIATATEGAAEIIENEISGQLAPVGNVEALATAIGELVLDGSKRSLFGDSGRARIEHLFSLERMLSATEQLYQQVIEE